MVAGNARVFVFVLSWEQSGSPPELPCVAVEIFYPCDILEQEYRHVTLQVELQTSV